MEAQRTHTAVADRTDFFPFSEYNQSEFGGDEEGLNRLLAANAKISLRNLRFRTDQEELEAALMKNPLSNEKAFSYFGFLLGAIPSAAIFLKFALSFDGSGKAGLFFLLFCINLVCAISGFLSGKMIHRMISETENRSWSVMLLLLPFIGALWGILTGGSGGLLIFGIGAIFGAIIAAAVGAIAFPAFTIFHRVLIKGEMIGRNQFLPIAFGITFIISAFILGL